MRSGEEPSVESQENWTLLSGTAKHGPVSPAVIVPICTVLNKSVISSSFLLVKLCKDVHVCTHML